MTTHTMAAPRLADGVELLGELRDSGFREPPSLVRRGDGQVVQLPRLLYLVAGALDGQRGWAEIADEVSGAFGRRLDAGGVRFVIDEKLRPLGLVAGDRPQLFVRADPMLALRLRTAVVPASLVGAVARVLAPLFLPAIVVGALSAFVALDVWVFAVHGLAQAVREAFLQPLLLLVLFGLVVAAAAFHECGHAAACHYGGARPGPMGVGVYLVWPALYTDVTDAYRLGRRDRLRTDLGGVYFNALFVVVSGAGYLATGFAPLLLVVPLVQLEILHQLMPVLRLDGYLIVSDLAGVPDVLGRMKPILLSLVPGRSADPRVSELKRGARVLVTAYVVVIAPLLLGTLGLLLVGAPRIVGTAAAALVTRVHWAAFAFGHGRPALGAISAIEAAVLVLPVAGLGLGLGRSGRRAVAAVARRGPATRAGALALVGAGAVGLGFAWWPSHAYRPIESDERGTLQAGFSALDRLPSHLPTEPEAAAPADSTPRPAATRPVTTPTATARRADRPRTATAPMATTTGHRLTPNTTTPTSDTTPPETDTTTTDTTTAETDTTSTGATTTDTTTTDTTATDTTPTTTTTTGP
jgi:putative peptide zinc metalloprotease protein